MLRGDQFIKMLSGNLKVDEDKLNKFTAEFTRDYPNGDLLVNRGHFSIQVRYKTDTDGNPLCMKCGGRMTSRVNQYRKNGTWQQKARKDNVSNWECPKCYPEGYAPLIVGAGIGED
jgi:hypothetical protein